jgi:hypothetical protein
MQKRRTGVPRLAVTAAVVLGAAAGSYGIASAASGSNGATPTPAASPPSSSTAPSQAPGAQQPWGRQRSDETPLTGDTAAGVSKVASAQVPGATIVRVETDADGHAAYEAHMVKANGTLVTVYVDKAYKVVGVQTGMPGPPPGAAQPPQSA